MADEFQVPFIYVDFSTLVPDENPLSDGGKWGPLGNLPQLKVLDTGGAIHGSVEFAVNFSIYYAQAFRGNVVEAFGCTPATGLGAALESQRVGLFTDPAGVTGYEIIHGGGISESYFFRRYDAGGFTGIGGAHSRDDHPDILGLRITPTEVQAWGNYGGAWEKVITASDTAHRGTFFAGLGTEEQGGLEEVGFSCFGAGIPNRTQFFRWLYN